MIIYNFLLDNLTAKAQASPRLRMNLDLRNSAEDQSQRMLNAIEPGSVVPIHRHRKTSETVVVLRQGCGGYFKRLLKIMSLNAPFSLYRKRASTWPFPGYGM